MPLWRLGGRDKPFLDSLPEWGGPAGSFSCGSWRGAFVGGPARVGAGRRFHGPRAQGEGLGLGRARSGGVAHARRAVGGGRGGAAGQCCGLGARGAGGRSKGLADTAIGARAGGGLGGGLVGSRMRGGAGRGGEGAGAVGLGAAGA